jgi:hypothetical protein
MKGKKGNSEGEKETWGAGREIFINDAIIGVNFMEPKNLGPVPI